MTRRTRRIVIFGIVALLVFVGSFGYGFLAAELKLGPHATARRALDWARSQPTLRRAYYRLRGGPADPTDRISGAWQPLPPIHSGADPDDPQAASLDQLRSVGYLSGYRPAGELAGVTIHIPELTYRGLNLITSGHAQEARLTDMEGTVLHRWTYEFGDAFPGFKDTHGRYRMNPFFRDFWRRSYLYPNGDLLAIYDGFGMIKIDKDSNLIWAVPGGVHHDVFVGDDGLIYTLTREQKDLPEYDEARPVLEDFIVVLGESGEVIRKVSVLKAFEQSSFASYLEKRPSTPDILHTNTIQVFDGSHADRSSIFRQGNILISPRNINVIAIMDMDSERIVWATSGQWIAQHEPELLPGGNIVLFDNKGHRGMSKVIEFDPLTQQISWAYEGTPENGFYTESSGAAHRLPNGNTLIVESNSGRAFEVTRDNRIVWEYFNPERAGEDRKLIATLFDVVRLGPEFPLDWLR